MTEGNAGEQRVDEGRATAFKGPEKHAEKNKHPRKPPQPPHYFRTPSALLPRFFRVSSGSSAPHPLPRLLHIPRDFDLDLSLDFP